MSFTRTKTIWDELVRLITNLGEFADVRAYPLHRVRDAQFLRDFPGLKMPACLVVYLGHDRTAKGQELDRIKRWSAIVADKDAKGDAYETAIALVDKIEDDVLDQQVLDDEVTIHASSKVSVAYTGPRYAVYEIGFETRDVDER